MERREIVIVGGGVAGLTLAKFLAKRGVDFVLLEEHNRFFMKACGEGVSMDRRLPFHDLYESKGGLENRIVGSVLHFPYGQMVSYRGLSYTIDKEAFEAELARQAESLGGEIRMEERVERLERRDGGIMIYPQEILCRCVAGCDGVFSIVRRFFKQPRGRLAFALSGEAEKDEEDHLNRFYFGKRYALGGYAWRFPKEETYNVGLGSFYPGGEPRVDLELLRDEWGAERVRGAWIPTYLPSKTFFDGGVLLGDAAPQINYVSGGGVNNAMACAKIASDVLSEIHDSGRKYSERNLRAYEERWRRILWRRPLEYCAGALAYAAMARSDAYSLLLSRLFPIFTRLHPHFES